MNRSLSKTRIVGIASLAVLVIIGAFLVGPAKRYYTKLMEPVIIRPAIVGVVNFHGVPAPGVRVRAAEVASDQWPNCFTLPTVAVSDRSGRFLAFALLKPRAFVKQKQVPIEVCLTRGQTQLDTWITFFSVNEARVWWLRCNYPVPKSEQYDNRGCYEP